MKKTFLILMSILIFSFVLHVLLIDKIPPGLTNDEVDIGYEAYSLSKTGKDQWGNFLPSEFSGFGGNRLPFLVYSTIPFIGLFGLKAFSLRLTTAFFAILIIWVVFLLAKNLFNWQVAIISALFLAISPWFFSLTRITNESIPAAFFITLGIWFFLKALKKEKFFIFSFFSFVISLYSYYSSRLFFPLWLATLIICFGNKISWKRKWLVFSLIFSFFVCLPIIKSMVIGPSRARLTQTNLTHDIGLISLLNEKRGECLQNSPFFVCRVIYNKPAIFLQKFFNNYSNHFSLDFLFLKNSAKSVMADGRLFYLSFLPVFLLGLFFLFTKKSQATLILVSWFMLAPIPDSLTSGGHVSRAFIMVIPLCIISAYGIWEINKKIKDVLWKRIFTFIFCTILLFEASNFLTDYFFYFPKFYSYYTHYEYQPLFEYLKKVEKNYENIYISRRYHDTKQYVFYLFYTQYDPKTYQEKKNVEWTVEEDGWIWIKRVGKWHFVDGIPAPAKVPDKTLLVGSPKEEINDLITLEMVDRPGVNLLKTISYLNGDPAFAIAEVRK